MIQINELQHFEPEEEENVIDMPYRSAYRDGTQEIYEFIMENSTEVTLEGITYMIVNLDALDDIMKKVKEVTE